MVFASSWRGLRQHPSIELPSGMFLLFGTKASEIILAVVTFACGYCGFSVSQRVFKRVLRMTLFFVPLFPLSKKFFVECSHCGGLTRLTEEQAANSVQWASSRSAT